MIDIRHGDCLEVLRGMADESVDAIVTDPPYELGFGELGQGPLPQQTPRVERPQGNHHPTVKPTALMRHLVRLVTPPGGTVLDPFAGSGTTLVAALAEGFSAIGIEREAEYVEIIRARIAAAQPIVSAAE